MYSNDQIRNSVEFWLACNNGDKEYFKKFTEVPISEIKDIDFTIKIYGQSPLSILVLKNDMDNLKLLVEYFSGSIYYQMFINDETENRSIRYLSIVGHEDMFEFLINLEGYDINKHNDVGETLLFNLCMNRKLELLEKLLKCEKLDVNKQSLPKKLTPLQIACMKGFPDVVRLLMEREDLDVNYFDNLSNNKYWNEPPIYISLRNENFDIARLLIRDENLKFWFTIEDDIDLCDEDDREEERFFDCIKYALDKENFEVFQFLCEIERLDVFNDKRLLIYLRYVSDNSLGFREKVFDYLINSKKFNINIELMQSTLITQSTLLEKAFIIHRESLIEKILKRKDLMPSLKNDVKCHIYEKYYYSSLSMILASEHNVHLGDDFVKNTMDKSIRILIDDYLKDPIETRYKLRLKLGYSKKDSARLYSMIFLLKLGILETPELEIYPIDQQRKIRFFNLLKAFPNEIIMKICNICYENKNQFIKQELINEEIVDIIDCY